MKDFRGRTVISGILVWHWVSEFCDSLEDPALPCATLRSARSARRPGPTHNNQKGPTPSAPLVHTRPGRTSRLLPGLLSVFCPYSVRIGCHASASPGGLVRILSGSAKGRPRPFGRGVVVGILRGLEESVTRLGQNREHYPFGIFFTAIKSTLDSLKRGVRGAASSFRGPASCGSHNSVAAGATRVWCGFCDALRIPLRLCSTFLGGMPGLLRSKLLAQVVD